MLIGGLSCQNARKLSIFISQKSLSECVSFEYNFKCSSLQLLNHRRNGFFIECGAADGVMFSNTLFLERQRSWTGLLVEANYHMFQKLTKVNRNVYATNSCLSTKKGTQLVSFRPVGLLGGISDEMDAVHNKWIQKHPGYHKTTTTQCFTLLSLLLAVGQTEVDYFSLDVEGPELEILQTIPFKKIKIKVISVEYRVHGDTKEVNTRESLIKLGKLRSFFKGLAMYEEAGILPASSTGNKEEEEQDGLDVIFVRV